MNREPRRSLIGAHSRRSWTHCGCGKRLTPEKDNNYALLDPTVYGRQETWEDSPTGWPKWRTGKQRMRTDGRPIAQWPRLKAGYSDDLANTPR